LIFKHSSQVRNGFEEFQRFKTHLNGVDIVSDADELGLLLLYEGGDGVDPVADDGRTLSGRVSLALCAGLCALAEALLLLLLGLGTVLVQKLEQLGSCEKGRQRG
jgi:hypothetical protein